MNIETGKIDEEILPLITELNRAGLKTIWSCAGHDSQAYITLDIEAIPGLVVMTDKTDDGKWALTFYWDREDG